MKYEDSRVKGIGKNTLRELEQLAMKASYALRLRGGIDVRGNDDIDFPEVHVYSIQAMLEYAYRLGREEAVEAKA